MIVHLVGGFLGSGKTTAILHASRLLLGRGINVGVVTNDQGRQLVDSGFLRSSGIETREVAGGCFCCHLADFRAMLQRLDDGNAPAVVFAEPVGSCADLVATIVKPFQQGYAGVIRIQSLSVLCDIRLLRQRLGGRPLPFSRDVAYIFDQQLDEADIVVLNKADLLGEDQARDVEGAARSRFPGKRVLLQSSLREEGVESWVSLIGSMPTPSPASLSLDYDRYAAGEESLAWYDATIEVDLGDRDGQGPLRRLLEALQATARRREWVGHVKILVQRGSLAIKLGFTQAGDQIPEFPQVEGGNVTITINVRVEQSAAELGPAVRAAIQHAFAEQATGWTVTSETSFHPVRPSPTIRVR
jgi:Ni2+-binding GTPase involved in maturation of urease and hydrogenase